MKLSRIGMSIVRDVLAYQGTRQSVQQEALDKIAGRKVFYGTDDTATIVHVGADYGWSKKCAKDEADKTRGAKLALLRALGMRG